MKKGISDQGVKRLGKAFKVLKAQLAYPEGQATSEDRDKAIQDLMDVTVKLTSLVDNSYVKGTFSEEATDELYGIAIGLTRFVSSVT